MPIDFTLSERDKGILENARAASLIARKYARHYDEHEETERQAAPEDRLVEPRKATLPDRDRADVPRRRFALECSTEPLEDGAHYAPSAGANRIRFQGSPAGADLSALSGSPAFPSMVAPPARQRGHAS